MAPTTMKALRMPSILNRMRHRYWKKVTSGNNKYEMSHAKKNGSSTVLSLLSNMTMPTTMTMPMKPRTTVSKVMGFLCSMGAKVQK